jgi:hypothetical protein
VSHAAKLTVVRPHRTELQDKGKGKVAPMFYLIMHYAMKAYGGVDVWLHIFLTSALVGGEWSASHPGRFTPGTHWIGGWVNPRSGLDDPSAVQPVASRYTDCAILRKQVIYVLQHAPRFRPDGHLVSVLDLKFSQGRLLIMPCSPVKVNLCFGGTYRLYLQGRKVSQEETNMK